VSAYADGGDSGGPVFFHATTIGASVVAPIGLLHSYIVDTVAVGHYPRSYFFSRRQMIELDFGTVVF